MPSFNLIADSLASDDAFHRLEFQPTDELAELPVSLSVRSHSSSSPTARPISVLDKRCDARAHSNSKKHTPATFLFVSWL